MSPMTHFLVGWAAAELGAVTPRERLWITLASVAPDLDGLGIVVDLVHDWRGDTPTEWFATQHHFLFHGLFGACVMVILSRMIGVTRFTALSWVFVSFHLHLLCDLLGSRGPSPWMIWPIHYLGPLSYRGTVFWKHQWPLNAWQNIAITAVLIAFMLVRAVQKGRTPLMLLNRNWDAVVVQTLRRRWRLFRGKKG